MKKQKWFSALAVAGLLLDIFSVPGSVATAQTSRYFPETGHTVSGLFLTYWNTHGGLAQQGYPISEELQEQSDTDGKVYTMQYFERAVFEMHPENPAPYNVLLSLLGVFYYNEKYGGNAPNQHASTINPRLFSETGKTVGGVFRTYWETHGGLAQQGYPISNEFSEVSQTNGMTYTVQYFQRAVFEMHPENPAPYDVLLSLLGVFYYNKRHSGAQPTPPPGASPTPTQAVATATATPAPVQPAAQVLFFNAGSGLGQLAIIDQKAIVFNQTSFQLDHGGWTHGVSIGNGLLLFYGLTGGGRIGKLNADGSYQNLKLGIPYNAGWDQITPMGNSELAFFNPSSKNLVIEQIASDGTQHDLSRTTLSLAWQHVVGFGNSLLYLYLDDPVDQFTHTAVGRVDSQGNFTTIYAVTERPRAGVPRGGWYIVPLDDSHLMRYNTTSGQYYIETIASTGTVTEGPVQTMAPGWTNFVYFGPERILGSHGVLFAYRPDTGAATAKAADPSFNFTDLKSYDGPTALKQGWTVLTLVR